MSCANNAMHPRPGAGKYAALNGRPLVIANVRIKEMKTTIIDILSVLSVLLCGGMFAGIQSHIQLGIDSGGRGHFRGELMRFGMNLDTMMAEGRTNEMVSLLKAFNQGIAKGGSDYELSKWLGNLSERVESNTNARTETKRQK